MSTLRVNKLESTSTTDGGISIDTSGHVTVDGVAMPSAGPLSNRNLIINGAMQVAQRGTSVTMAHDGTSSAFIADRFQFVMENADALDGNFAQVSNDSPDGFSNSIKWTTSTIEAQVSADDFVEVRHPIEAQNLQHLDYGASGAKSLTVSFWVKSSETGTYGLTLYQGDGDDIIGTTYTIDTADTWEYKTHTFTGNTAAAISNDNGLGLELNWTLFAGSNYTGTDNTSWGSSSDAKRGYGHTANGVPGTTNATWLLTGVQLEVGTVATPFEHRSYGDELAKCQRYYYKIFPGVSNANLGAGYVVTTSQANGTIQFPVNMREAPTSLEQSGTASDYAVANRNTLTTCTSVPSVGGSKSINACRVSFTTGATLNLGDGVSLNTNSTNGFLAFTAEL